MTQFRRGVEPKHTESPPEGHILDLTDNVVGESAPIVYRSINESDLQSLFVIIRTLLRKETGEEKTDLRFGTDLVFFVIRSEGYYK